MGEIRKVLAMGELPPRDVTPTMLWGDLCEDVHLHFRNLRFDYSEDEWAHFRAGINHIGMGVEYAAEENDYEEGDPNFLIQVLYNEPVLSQSAYYPDRVTVELQKDNTVHFHYRDLRMHLGYEEFKTIAGMFVDSLNELDALTEFPHKGIKKPTLVSVPVESVQPYDAGHRPLAEDDVHREGIEYAKGLIKEGRKLRPILVNDEGQRLDGFKRYMAQLESGIKEIECIVDPFGEMGGQHNQNMIADEELGEANVR